MSCCRAACGASSRSRCAQYQRTLEAHALLDFSGVLERAVKLLKEMDEFAQSRFRLEARYRHVLVDEFQDTSRAQWELVAQLVRSWGEGLGAAADAIAPSIFIVGDRKQSIYGFRDADVVGAGRGRGFVVEPAARGRSAAGDFGQLPIAAGDLAFVNDVFDAVEKVPERADRFRYDETDRFRWPTTLRTCPRPVMHRMAAVFRRRRPAAVAAVERAGDDEARSGR